MRKYDRTHDYDDPDFFKNRPPVILKKKRVRTKPTKPPLAFRILETVGRLFHETVRANKKVRKQKQSKRHVGKSELSDPPALV